MLYIHVDTTEATADELDAFFRLPGILPKLTEVQQNHELALRFRLEIQGYDVRIVAEAERPKAAH